MHQMKGHRISHVQAGSIASDLGIEPDDFLLLLDGEPLLDIFDYRMRQMSEHLLLTVQTAGGLIEFDIEKDEEEDLGLEFAEPLMAKSTACQNHCVFCFIDQLPQGLRPSLYFKDDDLRLSFLTGNYVSLTNISDPELDRLIGYRLSPMNISVHATDPLLRTRMMRHAKAGDLLGRLRRIAASGIAVNAQIVLCPGLNDGEQLDRTINDLIDIGPSVLSIAVVPVGLTRYRQENGLYPLRPLSAKDAADALAKIRSFQEKMLEARQTRLVYAADELYLKAGQPLPAAEEYEDFPQLENGVGMASLLVKGLADGLSDENRRIAEPLASAWPQNDQDNNPPAAALIATGTLAAPLLEPFMPGLSAKGGLDVRVFPVINRFFGETVTVAGLLTGQDLSAQLPDALRQISAKTGSVHLILPNCLFKTGTDLFLDDCSLQQLSNRLACPVHVCTADAQGLIGLLNWLNTPKGVTLS